MVAADSATGSALGRRLRGIFSRERLTGPTATVVVSTAAINILRIGNTMLLTRLLAPRDFGLVGIIGSIFFAISMITDAGFQSYIVRHERGDEPEFLDAIWSIHMLRGLLNGAFAAALAWPLAMILDKPEMAPLMAVVSLTLVIDGAMSLTLLTALRRNLVRRLSIVDTVAFLAQLVTGVIAAWLLRNAWALIISMLAYSLLRTTASYLVFPDSRRRFRIDRALSGDLWRFSRIIAASSMLTLLMSQVDKLVLARLFTLSEFGVYAIAANLAIAPIAIVGLYTSRVVYPAMAEAGRNEPASVKRRFYELRGPMFYLYLFGAGGLIGGAPMLIRLLYDPRYVGAGPFLQLLAIATALSMLTRSANEMLVATGHTRTTLIANLARAGWLVLGGVAGLLLFGPIGLVGALAVIEVPPLVYYFVVMRRLSLLDAPREGLAFAVLLAGVAGGVVVNLAAHWLLPWL
ncbi:oligosaccharide flippase family protein [Sphingomonas sp.]|uniref:oligosaccharide flippase family protein n=1 Tax=Sphingomonas sp. TaxID=28214 RepID=UPI0025DCF1CE|nr:oligosaccharide flippase family protein [Sphingomonas sp.]